MASSQVLPGYPEWHFVVAPSLNWWCIAKTDPSPWRNQPWTQVEGSVLAGFSAPDNPRPTSPCSSIWPWDWWHIPMAQFWWRKALAQPQHSVQTFGPPRYSWESPARTSRPLSGLLSAFSGYLSEFAGIGTFFRSIPHLTSSQSSGFDSHPLASFSWWAGSFQWNHRFHGNYMKHSRAGTFLCFPILLTLQPPSLRFQIRQQDWYKSWLGTPLHQICCSAQPAPWVSAYSCPTSFLAVGAIEMQAIYQAPSTSSWYSWSLGCCILFACGLWCRRCPFLSLKFSVGLTNHRCLGFSGRSVPAAATHSPASSGRRLAGRRSVSSGVGSTRFWQLSAFLRRVPSRWKCSHLLGWTRSSGTAHSCRSSSSLSPSLRLALLQLDQGSLP